MCQTRAGESGSWFGIAPNEAKALATALAIRPPIGMIAPSPAPLTPSGLLGDRWFSSEIARYFDGRAQICTASARQGPFADNFLDPKNRRAPRPHRQE
jgi:hypothetical protein